MRKTRTPLKIASLLLALVLVAAVIPAAPAGAIGMGNVSVNFSDVPEDSWYHDYVYLCASWGIIDGKEGSFRGDFDYYKERFGCN